MALSDSDSAEQDEKEEPFLLRAIKIAFVVALYWFVSITMVFLNNHLLDSKELDAPLFVTLFQCVVSVVLCWTISLVSSLKPGCMDFPSIKVDMKVTLQILPLSVVFVAMITFNNLCLKHVGVAFYTVGRSLSTVFNVLLSYVILGQTTSLRALLCCGVILGELVSGVVCLQVSLHPETGETCSCILSFYCGKLVVMYCTLTSQWLRIWV